MEPIKPAKKEAVGWLGSSATLRAALGSGISSSGSASSFRRRLALARPRSASPDLFANTNLSTRPR
jgi:hypothetical protein